MGKPARTRLHVPGSGVDTALPVLCLAAAARDLTQVREHFHRAGASLTVTADVPEALRLLKSQTWALAVVDLAGGDQALAAVQRIRHEFPKMLLSVVLKPAEPEFAQVLAQVSSAGRNTAPAAGTLREARAQFEREWIAATLAMHDGKVGEAARALGIQRTNLYRKVRQLKVPRAVISGRK